MRRSAYPLQWPARLARTKPADRKRSAFGGRTGRDGLSPHATATEVIDELARLGSGAWVITSNLPSRGPAGVPYADAPKGEDPGIAVWFEYAGLERVLACDRWYRPEENLRAIAKSIEAMRGLERWGVADVMANVFTGFAAALPAGQPEKRSWREVFGVAALVDTLLGSSTDDLLAVVKARHRKLIASAHPDAGGDHADAAELNAALAEAEKELATP
jgi:hypothetical protein